MDRETERDTEREIERQRETERQLLLMGDFKIKGVS